MIWLYEITPSIQGEGKHAQTDIVIVRTMTCNLKCQASEGGFDCDTYYTWKKGSMAKGMFLTGEEAHKRILEAAKHNGAKTIMLTGGEPLVWQNDRDFQTMLKLSRDSGFSIDVETNGTLDPTVGSNFIDFFVISPKASQYSNRYNRDITSKYKQTNHIWKFVVSSPHDVGNLAEFLKQKGIGIEEEIWLMPEGNTPEKLDEHLADFDMYESLLTSMGYFNVYVSDRLQIRGRYA